MSEDREPDYRFTLANERTFLAWVRTAVALLASALFVLHLLDPGGGATLLGLLLLAAAGVAVLGGFLRFRAVERAIRTGGNLPAAPSTAVLAGVVLLAVVAVTVSAFL